jgi:FKBP-type peptidyl-prolyl cis-trans isomerase FklB
MKTTPLLLAALCVPSVGFAQTKKPATATKPATQPAPAAAAPAAGTGAAPAAPGTAAKPAAPELSPAEAKKRLSLALGTFFANRQKNSPNAAEKVNYDKLAKGLSQVIEAKDPSYALGAQYAGQLVHDGIDVTISDLVAGFKAVLETGKPLLTQEEVNEEVQKLQAKIRQKQQEVQQREAAKNEAEGKAFLDKNRTAEGVQTTESGLQYKVLEPAKDPSSPRPTADDTVTCGYRGTLLDGTEFDKSPEGQPRSFGLRGVVKGWTEGIPLMQVGSKYRFWVPAALGYGTNPRPGGAIKPGHTLVFDVELVSIQPKTSSPTPAAPGQAVSQPIKIDRGEKAVATTPPIAVQMIDGKPVVSQVTPEQEAEAKRKAAEAEAKKAAEAAAKAKPQEGKKPVEVKK